VNIINGRLAQ